MSQTTIVGVDGGATKVSAWQVIFDREKKMFCLGTAHAEGVYADIPGYVKDFKPVDVAIQFKELADAAIRPTRDEQQQETVYVEACARAIMRIARETQAASVIVGIGMPGLKTADMRGIHVVANGPRMLHYSDLLEERLQQEGMRLETPIARLGSDADYCGIGENYAEEGAFRTVDNAYYLGGGTGVADAMKLHGALLPFDQMKPWMAKTWEMQYEDGRSMERFCSASGIQSIYADITGKEVSQLNADKIFPPQIALRAADGDPAARETYDLVTSALSAIIYERIETLYAGWQNGFKFMNPNRPALQSEHEYLKTLLDRVIIGQRLGQLYNMEEATPWFAGPLREKCNQRIHASQTLDKKARDHYGDAARYLKASQLREAPALGAGIDAFFMWQNES
ncbi:MAG: ROK family protein [Calditrichaeota bacterium]|nr:MAG: ROK family protein [Calditrichota bacterium]